jgi:hypothetical protein
MEHIKSLKSVSTGQFVDYCIQIKEDENRLEALNILINKSVTESEEYAIYYILFRQFCWNGIPKYKAEFIDVFEISDDKEAILAKRYTLDSEIFENINLIDFVVNQLEIKHNDIISNLEIKCKFYNYLLAYYYYTIVYDIAEHDNEELLAKFICSISSSNIKEFKNEIEFINDEIILFTELAFSEIFENYFDESNYIVVSNYNQPFGIETPYDYFSLSRNIIDKYI